MSPENPSSKEPPGEEPGKLQQNPELEDFFQRLPSNLRWPKPDAAAVAAAVDAIQRLSGSPEPSEPVTLPPEGSANFNAVCTGCGQPLGEGMRFCGNCGLAIPGLSLASATPAQTRGVGQHHYHHHYHHFVPTPAAGGISAGSSNVAASTPRVTGSVAKSAPGGRAESAARQLVQDWAQACNTKHLDDLLELYSPDATLIRSNIPPVRSLPAIREFLFSLLEAGLGDVEMDSLRTEVLGDVALEIGRCKMLVPVAMGKRREDRGKYLMVLVRQPAGPWKILADCWSSDLAVSAASEPAARKGGEASGQVRKR